MALSNHERVGKVLETMKEALRPYIVRELKAAFRDDWTAEARSYYTRGSDGSEIADEPDTWHVSVMLNIMINGWNDVFGKVLGRSERTIVFELRDYRNKWAHQQPFTADDAYRVYDDVERLLEAIASPTASQVKQEKEEMLRLRFEQRAKMIVKVVTRTKEGLTGWRGVIAPLPDVASGTFVHAEFAADLWEVHLGRAASEYGDAREFFRRTYITQGISNLLRNALQRLSGKGGDPVIELQTNFGGGKTHSMLALYHHFSGVSAAELPGVEQLIEEGGAGVPRGVQ